MAIRVLTGLPAIAAAVTTAMAGLDVLRVLRAAREPAPVMFSYGLAPVEVSAPASWTNESCAKCHEREYEQWKTSRHALAADNHHFKVELLDPGNRQQYCLNCHAPRTPGGALFPTQEPADLDTLYETRPEWLRAGVDCLTCHVRDGEILATRLTDAGRSAHPLRHAPELGRAEYCAGCHQFALKDNYFPDSFRGHFQQASLDEFLQFRHAGNDVERCHECHMPDGDHAMPGAYVEEMLGSAVDLELDLRWDPAARFLEIDVAVLGGYVGHRIPGGETFRSLSVHTLLLDADGRPLDADGRPLDADGRPLDADGRPLDSAARNDAATLLKDSQRKYVARWPQDEQMKRPQGAYETGDLTATPNPDTRLYPEETRRYLYATSLDPDTVKQPVRARAAIVYHLMGSSKAKQFGHAPEDVMWIVHEAERTIDLGNQGADASAGNGG